MIEVKKIEKSYNGEKVLKGVSLSIADGEFISIMGKSGSGKSTLLNIIGGFIPADHGNVLWNGQDISTFTDEQVAHFRCHTLGFVFQSFRLIGTLNVEENILLPASLAKRDPEVSRKRLAALAEELKIIDVLHKYPAELSGGQSQRAAIARALTFAPEAVILDEPTGALDSENEAGVMKLLKRVNEQEHITVIQVTHSERVASYGDRIIHLTDGLICR